MVDIEFMAGLIAGAGFMGGAGFIAGAALMAGAGFMAGAGGGGAMTMARWWCCR